MGEGGGGGVGISGEIWAEDTTHVKALSWGCLGSLWAGGACGLGESSQARQLGGGISMGGELGRWAVSLGAF